MESDFDPETADIIAWGISPDGNTPGTVIYWLTRGAKNLERIEVPATAKWGVVRDGHTVAVAVGEPANLVLVDASARAVVDRENSASKSRNNPYHARDLPDPVVTTIWAGRVTHRR